MALDKILARVERSRDDMVSTLADLCRIPAVGPDNGGDGEAKKAAHIQKWLQEMGLKVERFDAPDKRVPGGKRPNLVARVGRGPRLWFLVHSDVVPPGDPKGWSTDPFDPKLREGKLYGRGTEDNGQDIVSVLSAYQALTDAKAKPGRPLGFAIVSDEETGSAYGVEHLLEKGVFSEGDAVVVPDRGVATGDEIEVAEKGLLWLRLTIRGKQGHASLPTEAVNAHRAGAYLLTLIDATLPRKFAATDPIFRPWNSTFEPTKHEANVPNVNTIPGEDVFYFDCRILPSYKLKAVLEAAQDLADQASRTFGVKATAESLSEESSPPTPSDAPVVRDLTRAIRKVRGIQPKLVGVGSGTAAAPLRRRRIHAVVWCTTDEVGHSTNEYAKVDNLVGDAKVFAALMAGLD